MKNKISNFFKFFLKDHRKLSVFLLLILFMPSLTFACSIVTDSFSDCIYSVINMIVGVVQWISVILLQMSAYLFDNFLFMSLSTNLYDSTWIKVGWAVFRDFANIAFILGIIIIGIYMIIGKQDGKDGWERMLLNLIIAALAMNFSMFIGRIIIDMGNFTASVFYRISSVEVTTNVEGSNLDSSRSFWLAEKIIGSAEPYYGKRTYATAFVSYINPYQMKDPKIITSAIKSEYNSTNGQKFIDEKGKTIELSDDRNTEGGKMLRWLLLFNGILSIWVLIMITRVFFVTSFTFIARAGYLIYALIKAPIWFAWSFLPGGDHAFKEWFTDIITKSFCITVFTSGLWVLMMFVVSIQNELFGNVKESSEDMILAYLLVFGKAFLIMWVVQTLGKKTTKLCEGGKDGSMSLGEKFWSAGAGAFGIAAGWVMPGGGIAKFAARSVPRPSRRSAPQNQNQRDDGQGPARSEWSDRNDNNTDSNWNNVPRGNQPVEAVLSKNAVDKLNNFDTSKYNTGYINTEEVKSDSYLDAKTNAMENVEQGVWEKTESPIPLAAYKTKPISEIDKNVLKDSGLSSVAASSIMAPAQTDMSASIMKSLRSSVSSDDKSASPASEIISKKQNSEVIINTSGATINGENLNIRADREHAEAEQTAESAAQDARVDAAVADSRGAPEQENTDNQGPQENQDNNQNQNHNENQGQDNTPGENNESDSDEEKKTPIWKKLLSKGVEKTLKSMDKFGASDEYLKIIGEREKASEEKMKDWEKRREKAEDKADKVWDSLEDHRIKLEQTREKEEEARLELGIQAGTGNAEKIAKARKRLENIAKERKRLADKKERLRKKVDKANEEFNKARKKEEKNLWTKMKDWTDNSSLMKNKKMEEKVGKIDKKLDKIDNKLEDIDEIDERDGVNQ